MKKLKKIERSFPLKPEWRIILDHLVYHDSALLFRVCRKMITLLDRMQVEEIRFLLEKLNPTVKTRSDDQFYGQNWPKSKGSPFNAEEIYQEIFRIADIYLPDDEITKHLSLWIHQEQLSFLSRLLERRNAPLGEVVDAVKRYLSIFKPGTHQALDDEILGLRVGLISRFLSDNLLYINVAKEYIKISEMDKILDRTVGLASGNGKLGGKSAGMILARQVLLDRKKINPLFENVFTPKSRFLTSDVLLEFIHYNALEEFVFTKYESPEAIKKEFNFLEYIFKNSQFPPESMYAFNKILDDMKGKPMIVRSSSLLEDSFEASFSGKYKSLFISNTGTKEERMAALVNAVTEVYASTFGPDPIEYRRERGLLDFREEMGILIQEVVGNQVGKYYLPCFAGVAYSYNEFRWSPRLRREDGVIRIVAGLGTRAVDRTMNDYPTLLSPGQPALKVNTSVDDILRYSQQYVDVINMEKNRFETIRLTELIDECNGYFPGIEKITSMYRDGTLVDPVSAMADFRKEQLVVTFNNLVNKSKFINQIKEILTELQLAFKSPVDVEFASDGEKIFLLQCRPQSQFSNRNAVRIPSGIPRESIIFSANEFVNSGIAKNIEYVVYVDGNEFNVLPTIEDIHEIVKIVSTLNRMLPRKKFILIGPGRWGSRGDVKLGVPVIYSDINNTAMLIEVAREKHGYVPDLSFGTHFFQDLVESNIMYLPLYPDNPDNVFNEQFFLTMPNHLEELLPNYSKYSGVLKLVKLDDDRPLSVYMDGEIGKAVAYIEE